MYCQFGFLYLLLCHFHPVCQVFEAQLESLDLRTAGGFHILYQLSKIIFGRYRLQVGEPMGGHGLSSSRAHCWL